MTAAGRSPDRIHLLAHANPATKDIERFGFRDARAMIDFARDHVPPGWRITADPARFEAPEDQSRGGRRDDAARIRDIQRALDDPRTFALVACNGGAYFTRILPHLDFTPLMRRRTPLWALGFSEMTSLVNAVATYPAGRGVYWLCPSFLAWKIKPRAAARSALAAFWQRLPAALGCEVWNGEHRERRPAPGAAFLHSSFRIAQSAIRARLVSGRLRAGPVRVIGGCLSVMAGLIAGPIGRRLRPDGKWLAIEDVNEAPYRVDRFLAALKVAGWFERLGGVLVGDFHTADDHDQTRSVLEILRFHLPAARRLPVLVTRDVGHVWPMRPLLINRPLQPTIRGRRVELAALPAARAHPYTPR
jgi:muramoyltetrapeptide carboxypeptidase LdcA involved in peptidoglycan recycling